MSQTNRIEKNDLLLRMFTLAVVFKLLISPWATGDFISSFGILISYACDGLLIGLVVLQLNRFPKMYLKLIWITLLTGLAFLTSTFLFTNESVISAAINHLKLYLPILAVPTLVSLTSHSRISFNKVIYGICLLILLLIVVGLATFPPSMNRLEQWLPTYFGGLHTTAYVALLTIFAIHGLWHHGLIPAYRAAAIMLFLIGMIFFGWGVRTASIGILIFFGGLIFSKFRFLNRPITSLFLPIGLALGMTVLQLLDFAGDVDQLSSGRISMYIEKYHQVMRNSLPQWFIGNGFKSDLIFTDVWWWEAKGAHSDFITFLVEGGIIYFVGFLMAIAHLFKCHPSIHERLMLMGMLSTSAFSNGVFARPIAAYLLSVVLVIYHMNTRPTKVQDTPNAE